MFKGLPFSLLIVIFFNLLFWQIVIPIWHFPDEQAHFGQVAFRAEHGRVQEYRELSTNREITISEEFLGTKRDNFGNNRFTYHPEYKINYSNNLEGLYEPQIESLNNERDRKTEVIEESTRYPLLYYFLASQFYDFFNKSDLFTRVYAVRFFSTLIFIGTLVIIFLTSKLIFPKNVFLQISLISFISFMPMFVFSSSGVTSDVLYNFLFISSIYLVTKILFTKFNSRDLFLLVLSIITGIATKVQFQIIWLTLIYAGLIIFFRLKTWQKVSVILILPAITITTLIFFNWVFYISSSNNVPPFSRLVSLPYIPEIGEVSSSNPQASLSFPSHFVWTMENTISRVLPWYFGVYKWLSLTLPPLVYQIINRILIISLLGIIYFFYKVVKKKRFDLQFKILVFLTYTAMSYFIALTVFDWLFTKGHGFSFGIQGRYFFPVIIAHFGLVFVGLLALAPKSFKKWVAAILVFMTVTFNYFSLFWVASYYYETSSLDTFIRQASQYKPEIFKGIGIILIFLIAFISMMFYLYHYLIMAKQAKVTNKE